MPGVKKLHQDSENVGKAEYIFGHQFGMIGLLAEGATTQCVPLNIELPLSIDSPDPKVIEADLKLVKYGQPMINSISDEKERFNSIIMV